MLNTELNLSLIKLTNYYAITLFLHTPYNYTINPFEKSKENYKNYFESNSNNAKIWKGVKSITTLKSTTSSVPRLILQRKNSIPNPSDIANIFNKYFFSVADTVKGNIKYSHKHFFQI